MQRPHQLLCTTAMLALCHATLAQERGQEPIPATSSSTLQSSPPASRPATKNRPRSGGGNWGANYFPNVLLTTHEGKQVRFFDDLIKDKVVVINFIYTNCPDTCPLETSRLAEIEAILGDRIGRDTFFYSITVDPDRDTPEVLADYRKRYGCGPGWTFLTGKEDDVTLLRKKLGLYDPLALQSDTDHEVNIVVGNQATGRWMNMSPFVNPYVLAEQIGNWLHNWRYHKEDAKQDYSKAPKLRSITKGEGVFRTRCAACHTVGKSVDDVARQGPNLFGVTDRRDHEWLARWIAAPDKMLEQKDPDAMQLFEAWNRVPMPNMRLNGQEVASVIDYLQTETRRLQKLEPALAAAARQKAEHEASGMDSCCNKNLLIAAAEQMLALSSLDTEASTDPESASEPRRHLSSMSWVSIGLGCLLWLISARRRMSGK